MPDLAELLNELPLASLMLVVAAGWGVGRLTWRGISLGPAGGTLGVAIALGALGLDLTRLYGTDEPRLTIGALGFALFIYSVGFEAGPRFFSSILGGPGWRFVAVGTLVNVVAVGLALVLGGLLGLGGAVTAGAMAGALTSPATYAAAFEVMRGDPAMTTPLAVSFAFVYPIGLVAIVILIQVLPRLRGLDLEGEGDDDEGRGGEGERSHVEHFRIFEVESDEVIGASLATLDLPHRTGCHLARIHRGSSILAPDRDTRLERKDHVLVRGRVHELRTFRELVGPEIQDQELTNRMPSPRRVVVLSSAVVGETLRTLDLARRFRCLVVGIERSDVQIEPDADVHLEHGDVVEIVGRKGDVREAAHSLGRLEHSQYETDIGVYAGGIFIGLLIGALSLEFAGVDLSLGFAGGLLVSGILLGRARSFGPFNSHVPRAARQLVRDLGILLFVAEAGVRAGGSALGSLAGTFWPMLATGLVLSVVPVLLAVAFACRVLRMQPIDAWGSVGGGMTSSSALSTLQRQVGGTAPAVSYAASYAVASVLVTIAGRIIVLAMG